MHKRILKFSSSIFCVLLLVAFCVAGISAFAIGATDNSVVVSDANAEIHDTVILAEYVDRIANENATLAEADLNDIVTTITFSDYLTFEELEDYTDSYNLEIVQLQLRGLMDDGTRVSIFTKTDLGLAETERLIMEESLELDYQLVGATSIFALTSSAQLEQLSDDSRTFLADTSGDLYSQQNHMQAGAVRNNVEGNNSTSLFPQPITWNLENLGLL